MSPAAILLACGVATAAVDQATKAVVSRRLAVGRSRTVGGRFGLQRALNPRGGQLRLSIRQAVAAWLAVAGCVALSLALVASSIDLAAAVGFGLALGGAASNLADRLVRGAVEDFILIGRWPVFNLADAAMTVGAAAVIWSVLA